MKISCLVPTRGNPLGMSYFADTIFKTASNPDSVEVIFYIDNDDLPSKECADKLKEKYNIKYFFEDRIPLGKAVNECHKLSEGDIFFCGSDDIIMLTEEWDSIVIDAFNKIEDKIALFYGLEVLYNPGGKGGHHFMHRKWLDTLGYITPQYFGTGDNDHSWCNNQFSVVSDKWINSIAESVNRRFFIEIYHQHVNPRFNSSQKFVCRKNGGQVRKDLNSLMRDKINNPKKLYQSPLMREKRKEDVTKLKNSIKDFNSNKQKKYLDLMIDKYPKEIQKEVFGRPKF